MLDFVLYKGVFWLKQQFKVRAWGLSDQRFYLSHKNQRMGDGIRLKLNNRLIFQTTALGFMMIASNIAGFGGASFAPSVLPEVIEIKVPTLRSESRSGNIGKIEEKKITVKEYVRNYFSDIPIMIEIAKCESRFRQYDNDGKVLRGEKNDLDRGVMQINEYFHNENSDKLGYDIMTIEGNTAYARHLFEKYGVKPWKSSARCWGRTTAYSEFINLAMNNE